jgi:hypothetical protein
MEADLRLGRTVALLRRTAHPHNNDDGIQLVASRREAQSEAVLYGRVSTGYQAAVIRAYDYGAATGVKSIFHWSRWTPIEKYPARYDC